MTPELSTAEAARTVGVGLSTMKRWADSGLLPCIRTAGGHRRFTREALDRFLREQGAGGPRDAAGEWIDTLVARSSHVVEGRLMEARGRLGAWHLVAGELGAALVELGRAWRAGRVSVLEEHIASERLARALARVGEALPAAPDAPRCLLACAEGEEHTLGLSLAEICLREAGWTPLWAGRRTPTRELVAHVAEGDVALVALSASAHSSDPRALGRQLAPVVRACRKAGARLVLGGDGAWPETPAVLRVHDFTVFHELLQRRRR